MKKIFFTLLGALLMAAPASAQVGAKVDVNRLRANIAKSDSDIANPKNATKASAWLKRGEVFIAADAAPVSGLYSGMPETMLKLSMGDVAPTQETVGDSAFSVYTYEHVKVYVANGVVDFFVPITVVQADALDKAYEALDKAYQLDARTAKKVGEDMTTIRLKSFENGTSQYAIGNHLAAAGEFRRAYNVSNHPSIPVIDTISLYYAGMAAAIGEDYENSLKDIDKVIELGYENDGDSYRFKFIDLYNLDRKPESLQALETGISRFPTNELLIDLIMSYYAENDGDPSSVIPLVEGAIAKNPNNYRLYLGLGRVYEKLGQMDNAIAAMQKAVEIAPDDFFSNYLAGYFIVKKGDEMATELGKQAFTSRAAYQEALSVVNDVFRSAMAPLEKAFAINAEEIAVVELLKNLTYRLREEEGMQAKNDRYNELFRQMDGGAQ